MKSLQRHSVQRGHEITPFGIVTMLAIAMIGSAPWLARSAVPQIPATVAPVICIDPGHPSEVGRGASGKHTTEIHVVWVVANRLRDILRERGYQVVMTKRAEEQFVRNRARAEVANKAHAALMVRLHCDSGPENGIAVFVPEKQGVSQGVRGPSPQVISDSVRIGKTFHAALVKSLTGSLADRGLRPDAASHVGSRQGALTGSVFSHVPVVLVEICVLSSAHDERFIVTESGKNAVAHALANAVDAALGGFRNAAVN